MRSTSAPLVPVVTGAESTARDLAAIAAGIPSRVLMQRAGAAIAGEIALRYAPRLGSGVLVLAGPGNNGGDGWVVARALVAAGVPVRVVEPVAAKSDDARAERALTIDAAGGDLRQAWKPKGDVDRGQGLVVDALLGTGSSGAPRGDLATAIRSTQSMRNRGAVVVAIDIPSGLDASTGVCAGDAVEADLTLTLGTMKRGLLMDRGRSGQVVVLDIGLGARVHDGAPGLVDERWVARFIPPIQADAHKGTRKKLAIVGGAEGMAGAAMLAGRAALRSGAGMVRLVVAPESMLAVQKGEPAALAAAWPADDAALDRDIGHWADAVIIGPGLGRSRESRALVEQILKRWSGPVLLDADALNVFEGDAAALATLLGGKQRVRALITPHVQEFSRLSGVSVENVLAGRFDVGASLAQQLGAAVLLKGVPTVVTGADGSRLVSASGTPALATAGSGDVLSGIAGTLLAQCGDAVAAGAAGAWIHGRAAERAAGVRGVVLDDIVESLRTSWNLDARPPRYPVLVELPPPVAGERT